MAFQIVLLSGTVASGKTTLWQQLKASFPNEHIHVLKTKELIRELALGKMDRKLPAERRALQNFGDLLDKETAGRWVQDALVSLVNQHINTEPSPIFIVDAVRILAQIKAIREAYGFSVKHIHLKAPERELEERYKRRMSDMEELKTFKEVSKNPTEAAVHELEKSADIVVGLDAESTLRHATEVAPGGAVIYNARNIAMLLISTRFRICRRVGTVNWWRSMRLWTV